MFDTKLESEDEIIDVKDKFDNDSNIVILNENSEEVEDTMHDDTDNIISDNNEDKRGEKKDT